MIIHIYICILYIYLHTWYPSKTIKKTEHDRIWAKATDGISPKISSNVVILTSKSRISIYQNTARFEQTKQISRYIDNI